MRETAGNVVMMNMGAIQVEDATKFINSVMVKQIAVIILMK
jgi:hypothetical protein